MPKVEKGKFLYKGNRLGGSLHAVHGHTRLAIPSARFQDGDVIDYLSVAVATGS